MNVKQELIAILNRNQGKLEKIGAGGSGSFPIVDAQTQLQSLRIQEIRNGALTEFIQLAERARQGRTGR